MSETQGKRWCFTINSLLTIGAAEILLEDLATRQAGCQTYGMGQVEVSPSTGNIHVQGFIVFDTNWRFNRVKEMLKGVFNSEPHIELMKGSLEENEAYCSKEQTRAPDTQPVTWGLKPQREQGRRTDLLDATQAIREMPAHMPAALRLRKLARTQGHEQVFVKFHRGLAEYATALEEHEPMPDPEGGWSAWQQDLRDRLARTPDRRSIIWVYDAAGRQGKSQLVMWYISRDEGVALEGRLADMAYTYNREKIAFFDIPRAGSEHCDHLYRMGETLKNGFLHSTKYTPCVKIFSPPHVVYMSNSPPPSGAWSQDRLVLYTLHADGTFHVSESLPLFHAASTALEAAGSTTADISANQNPFAEIIIPQIDDLSQE